MVLVACGLPLWGSYSTCRMWVIVMGELQCLQHVGYHYGGVTVLATCGLALWGNYGACTHDSLCTDSELAHMTVCVQTLNLQI
jgi:hypothetical protein